MGIIDTVGEWVSENVIMLFLIVMIIFVTIITTATLIETSKMEKAENMCEQTCFNNGGFVKDFTKEVCECISYQTRNVEYYQNSIEVNEKWE